MVLDILSKVKKIKTNAKSIVNRSMSTLCRLAIKLLETIVFRSA